MRTLHHAIGLWRLVFIVVILLLLTITGQAQITTGVVVWTQAGNGPTFTVTTEYFDGQSFFTIPTGTSNPQCGLFPA